MNDTIRQLTPARWEAIQEAVDRVWDTPTEHRRQVLEEMCGDDPLLRQQVELMIEADEATSPLDESIADDALRVLAERERERQNLAGQQVGRFRLVRKLGEGGMGMVYLGERADGAFEQYVAVKLLRSTVSDDIEHARFRQEQQVLARLDHRSIAGLYDAGRTEKGRAYFIMEYVEGRRITEYCRLQRLDMGARVQLVLDVARALQYAHGKLIVHRDVKPSNILVNAQGRVKLLDFGISKLIDNSARQAAVTRSDERPMTLEYAAPEQIRGRDVTIQTDVYQLGVVLYELLTGHRPFRRGEDLFALAREICEVGAVRPSQAVRATTTATTGADGAAQQASAVILDAPLDARTHRKELKLRERQLAGDLDAIVMRAIARETEDRYASMEAFAADLEAYLAGKPVRARAPSVAYNTWKFLYRHPFAAAGVAMFALLLTAWATTATVQSQRITDAFEIAQAESAKATQTASFLESIFASWDPVGGSGDRILVRDLLEGARTRLYEELDQTPEVRARLMITLAELYQRLGLFQEQIQLASDALEIRESLVAAPDASLREVYHILAMGLGEASRYEEALERFDQARAQAVALGGDPLELAIIEGDMARALHDSGEFAQARALFTSSLASYRAAEGTGTKDYADTLVNFAFLLLRLDGWDEALEVNTEALSLYRSHYGERHQYMAIALNQRANLMTALGRLEEAEALLRQALEIHLERLEPNHTTITGARSDLARVLSQLGRFEEAKEELTKALATRIELYGETNSRTSATYFNLGDLLVKMGELEEAEAAYSAATAIDTELFGSDHPNVGMDLTRVADVVYLRGELASALSLYNQALAVLPEELAFRSSTLLGYGRVLRDLGQLDEARFYLNEALEIRKTIVPPGHPRLLEVEELLNSL